MAETNTNPPLNFKDPHSFYERHPHLFEFLFDVVYVLVVLIVAFAFAVLASDKVEKLALFKHSTQVESTMAENN